MGNKSDKKLKRHTTKYKNYSQISSKNEPPRPHKNLL